MLKYWPAFLLLSVCISADGLVRQKRTINKEKIEAKLFEKIATKWLKHGTPIETHSSISHVTNHHQAHYHRRPSILDDLARHHHKPQSLNHAVTHTGGEEFLLEMTNERLHGENFQPTYHGSKGKEYLLDMGFDRIWRNIEAKNRGPLKPIHKPVHRAAVKSKILSAVKQQISEVRKEETPQNDTGRNLAETGAPKPKEIEETHITVPSILEDENKTEATPSIGRSNEEGTEPSNTSENSRAYLTSETTSVTETTGFFDSRNLNEETGTTEFFHGPRTLETEQVTERIDFTTPLQLERSSPEEIKLAEEFPEIATSSPLASGEFRENFTPDVDVSELPFFETTTMAREIISNYEEFRESTKESPGALEEATTEKEEIESTVLDSYIPVINKIVKDQERRTTNFQINSSEPTTRTAKKLLPWATEPHSENNQLQGTEILPTLELTLVDDKEVKKVDALLPVIPVIVHDLRSGAVTEEEKQILSQVFGERWADIVTMSKNPPTELELAMQEEAGDSKTRTHRDVHYTEVLNDYLHEDYSDVEDSSEERVDEPGPEISQLIEEHANWKQRPISHSTKVLK